MQSGSCWAFGVAKALTIRPPHGRVLSFFLLIQRLSLYHLIKFDALRTEFFHSYPLEVDERPGAAAPRFALPLGKATITTCGVEGPGQLQENSERAKSIAVDIAWLASDLADTLAGSDAEVERRLSWMFPTGGRSSADPAAPVIGRRDCGRLGLRSAKRSSARSTAC